MTKEQQELMVAENMHLKAENASLKDTNERLAKEQAEFQQALIEKVKEIEASPKMWRWLRYGQLLFSLIDVIKDAIQKAQQQIA